MNKKNNGLEKEPKALLSHIVHVVYIEIPYT